jgi:hypothetical protein
MENYKELYFNLFKASEEAVNILIEAQQKCEELYSSSSDHICQVIPLQIKTININNHSLYILRQ